MPLHVSIVQAAFVSFGPRKLNYVTIKLNDIRTLCPCMCLKDIVIDYYLNLLLKDPRTKVNAQNSEGETALMLAIRDKKKWASERKVRALLADQRVNVNVKNKNGKSALDLAIEENLSLSLRLKIRFRQQSLPYLWK